MRRIIVLGIVMAVVLSGVGITATTPARAAGTTDLTLSPGEQTIDAGTTTTINLTVSDVDDGVGAYEFTLSTGGDGTASITDVDLQGSPATEVTNISADGSELTVDAAIADTADTGSVTIATVTIAGEAAGQTGLSLSNVSVGDENGNSYTIGTIDNADLSVLESTVVKEGSVTPVTVDGGTTAATSFEFDIADVSNDGNTDSFTITTADDVSFATPTVMVSDADGNSIQIEEGPTVNAANGGANNQLTFAVAPNNTLNTSEIGVTVESDVTYPSVSTNQSRNFILDIDDSSGDTATKSLSVAVQTTSTDSGSGDSTQSVSIVPTKQNISAGATGTYDVVIDGVDNGVGAYTYEISTNDTATATISDFTAGGDPGTVDTDVASDGSAVTVDAALADTADTGEVTIGTITITGEAGGDATIAANIETIGDESGNRYNVTSVTNASVSVIAGPGDLTGNGNPATDPDGDGVYEDVNGDQSVDVLDVQSLFTNLGTDAIANEPGLDFNGDGTVDVLDVQTLFTRL